MGEDVLPRALFVWLHNAGGVVGVGPFRIGLDLRSVLLSLLIADARRWLVRQDWLLLKMLPQPLILNGYQHPWRRAGADLKLVMLWWKKMPLAFTHRAYVRKRKEDQASLEKEVGQVSTCSHGSLNTVALASGQKPHCHEDSAHSYNWRPGAQARSALLRPTLCETDNVTWAAAKQCFSILAVTKFWGLSFSFLHARARGHSKATCLLPLAVVPSSSTALRRNFASGAVQTWWKLFEYVGGHVDNYS